MNVSEIVCGPLAQRLAWTLFHFLWQGLLIAMGVAALVWLLSRTQARGRYAAALAGLALMACCPPITFAVLQTSRPGPAASAGPKLPEPEPQPLEPIKPQAVETSPLLHPSSPDAAAPHPEGTRPAAAAAEPLPAGPDWRTLLARRAAAVQPYAVMAWLTGVILLSGRLLLSVVGVRRLARGRLPVSAELAARAFRLAERLGLSAPPGVYLSERIREAMLVGLWRPMVLLPAAWIAEMPPDVLEAVIAHELAHVRRLDLWANLLQRLVETLLFYHPAVWWLSRRTSFLREMCADDLAVEATGERMTYASVLELLGRRRLKLPAPQLAASIGGRKMALLDRVRNVLGVVPGEERLRWWPAGLLALLVPLGLWLASMAMAETKQQAPVSTAEGDATPQPAETGLAAFRSAVSPSFAKLVPAVFASVRSHRTPKEQRKGEIEIRRQYRAALDDFREQVHVHWPHPVEEHKKEQQACADAVKELNSLFSRAKGGELPPIGRDEAVRRILQFSQEFPNSPLSDHALHHAAYLYFDVKPRRWDEGWKLIEAVANCNAPLSDFRIGAMTNLASRPNAVGERLRSREQFAAKMREWHDPQVLEPLLLNPLPMESEERYVYRVESTLSEIENEYLVNAINMKADEAGLEENRKVLAQLQQRLGAAEAMPNTHVSAASGGGSIVQPAGQPPPWGQGDGRR